MMSYNKATLDDMLNGPEPIDGEVTNSKTVVLTGRAAKVTAPIIADRITLSLKLFGFSAILLGLVFIYFAQKDYWYYGMIALVLCLVGAWNLLQRSSAISSMLYHVPEPGRMYDDRPTTSRRALVAIASVVAIVVAICFGLAGLFADKPSGLEYGSNGNRFWSTTPTPAPKPPKEPRVKDMGPPVPYGPGATMTPPPPLPVVVLPPVAPPAPRAVTPRAPIRRPLPPVATHPIVPKPTTAPKPTPKKDDEYVLPPNLKPPKVDTPKKESHPKYGGDTDLGDSSKVTVHDPVEAGDSGPGD